MRSRFTGPALFVTLLALACQLAAGASMPRTVDPLSPISIICHTDGADGAPAAPLHRGPNCQLCLLCAAVTTAAPTLLSGSPIQTRATARLVRTMPLPVATAPGRLAARPRGPPAAA